MTQSLCGTVITSFVCWNNLCCCCCAQPLLLLQDIQASVASAVDFQGTWTAVTWHVPVCLHAVPSTTIARGFVGVSISRWFTRLCVCVAVSVCTTLCVCVFGSVFVIEWRKLLVSIITVYVHATWLATTLGWPCGGRVQARLLLLLHHRARCSHAAAKRQWPPTICIRWWNQVLNNMNEMLMWDALLPEWE